MENKFRLQHFLLYSKNFYKKYDFFGKGGEKSTYKTLWDDLRKVLTLDGYSGEYMSPNDIRNVVIKNCKNAFDVPLFQDINLFLDGIDPVNTWKNGYYNTSYPYVDFQTSEFRKHLKPYDYDTAIVTYCISVLRGMSFSEMKIKKEDLQLPDYVNGLPRPKGMSTKKLIDWGFKIPVTA